MMNTKSSTHHKSTHPQQQVKGKGFGWFRTGDIARLDEENYIYIMDRAKDIIIRGGENISCAEVESAFHINQSVMVRFFLCRHSLR
jgi:acyl-CoA synthetase (AMP-forming)/AMP-acid ligase II